MLNVPRRSARDDKALVTPQRGFVRTASGAYQMKGELAMLAAVHHSRTMRSRWNWLRWLRNSPGWVEARLVTSGPPAEHPSIREAVFD